MMKLQHRKHVRQNQSIIRRLWE